jgi:hypothetical protein
MGSEFVVCTYVLYKLYVHFMIFNFATVTVCLLSVPVVLKSPVHPYSYGADLITSPIYRTRSFMKDFCNASCAGFLNTATLGLGHCN